MAKKKAVFRGTEQELAELTRDALKASSEAAASPVEATTGEDEGEGAIPVLTDGEELRLLRHPGVVHMMRSHYEWSLREAYMEGANTGTDGWKTSKARGRAGDD